MDISIDFLPKCVVKINVKILSDEVKKERDKITKYISSLVNIPGFRKGKAPKNIVIKRYAKEIDKEIKNSLQEKALKKALDDHKLKLIGNVKIDKSEFSTDNSFEVNYSAVSSPKINLPEYKGIKIELNKPKELDAFKKEIIENYTESLAEFEDDEDRELKEKDIFSLNLKGTCEGKTLEEIDDKLPPTFLGKDDFIVHPDKPFFIEKIENNFIGTKPETKKEIEFTFPDKSLHASFQSLKGKKILFQATFKKIKKKILPEFNEELIKKNNPHLTMEKFEEEVKNMKKSEDEKEKETATETQIIDYLLKNTNFELPENIMKDEIQEEVNKMVNYYNQHGLDEKEIKEKKDEIFKQATKSATDKMKYFFIRNEIAKAEKIEATKEEIKKQNQYIEMMDKMNNKKSHKKSHRHNHDDDIMTEQNIILAKTFNFLKENAEITTK